MSKAIKCDRCQKFDDSAYGSQLNRSDLNFSDAFREQWYPDKIDLCEVCTKELLTFIKGWARLPKLKAKEDKK